MSTARKKTAAGIVWFEIPADNTKRAKAFSAKLCVSPFAVPMKQQP